MDQKQFQDWVVRNLQDLAVNVGEVKVTLAAQHVTLEEHQRRSTANEEAVEALKAELRPISVHVALVAAGAKVVLGLAAITTAILGVLRALGRV